MTDSQITALVSEHVFGVLPQNLRHPFDPLNDDGDAWDVIDCMGELGLPLDHDLGRQICKSALRAKGVEIE